MDGYNSNDKSIVVISFDEHIQLKCEVKEAMEQIEQGESMSIYEAFDRVIAKYID